MTTTTPSAATSFINIGERTNVTGESVMLGLVPSIQRSARTRFEVDPRDEPEDDSGGT